MRIRILHKCFINDRDKTENHRYIVQYRGWFSWKELTAIHFYTLEEVNRFLNNKDYEEIISITTRRLSNGLVESDGWC